MPAVVETKNDFECLVPLFMVKELNQHDSANISEYSKFIEDQEWGFQITGGAEFLMPITVFHVRECIAHFFYICLLCASFESGVRVLFYFCNAAL